MAESNRLALIFVDPADDRDVLLVESDEEAIELVSREYPNAAFDFDWKFNSRVTEGGFLSSLAAWASPEDRSANDAQRRVIARVVNLGQQLMSPKLRLPPVARRLSQRAREVLRRSSSEASCFSATVTTEYVLLAALSLERAPVAKFLRNHGLGPRLLCSIGPRLNSSYCSDLVQLDKETNAAILRADGIARQLSTELISAAALLLGILQVENSRASIALNQVGIDSKSLFDELMQWTKARKSRTVQGQK